MFNAEKVKNSMLDNEDSTQSLSFDLYTRYFTNAFELRGDTIMRISVLEKEHKNQNKDAINFMLFCHPLQNSVVKKNKSTGR